MLATQEELAMLVRLKKSDEGNEFIAFLENQCGIYLYNLLKLNGDDLVTAKGKAIALRDLIHLIKNSDVKLVKRSDKEGMNFS